MKQGSAVVVLVACILLLARVVEAKPWYQSYEEGKAYFDHSEWSAAEEDLKAAILGREGDAEVVRTYGMHFLKPYTPNYYLGRIYLALISETDPAKARQAVVYLEHSARDLPSGGTRYWLARAYMGTGQKGLAIEACQEALRFPSFPEQEQAAELLKGLTAKPPPIPPEPQPSSSPPPEPALPVFSIAEGYPFRPMAIASSTEPDERLVSVDDVWRLLDVDITWGVSSGYLVLERNRHVLMLYMGVTSATLDGATIPAPTPPIRQGGTAMVPIGLIARSIANLSVKWQPG